MFVTLCLNPTIQKTLLFKRINLGEVNRSEKNFTDVSGKGINVSRVLSQLGRQVLHITQLAKEDKAWFKAELEKLKIELLAVGTTARARTCTTLIEENCVTELVESGNKVEPETEAELIKAFDRLFADNSTKIDALVISGSKAPGFRDSLFAEIALKAHRCNVPLVLDIRGADLRALLDALRKEPVKAGEPPVVIKPNIQELHETFFAEQGAPLSENQIKTLLAEIFAQYGLMSVITRGKEPVLAFDGKSFLSIDSKCIPSEKIVNTIGCGDAFAAGFASVLAETGGFEEAVRQGIKCGALNAMTLQPGSIEQK
ncbi:MAG: bifunctional hydroxymethylpyrimidine kinase/phosphomethylpyrimidine kinase [Spirochaetaceae bacterium]|nr:bifunctional hydroxymethylpyrimidine kinase/phosphomethylpyrimidine kinase [Spirochaetaceae bacterium]